MIFSCFWGGFFTLHLHRWFWCEVIWSSFNKIILTCPQLAVVAVHAVRSSGEDAGEGRFSDPAGPQQHHTVRTPWVRRIPGGVGGDDRVGGRPAPATPDRLLRGAVAGLGPGDAGGDAGQEAVGEVVTAGVADAPAVELGLQAEAVPSHGGQHHGDK